MKRKRIAYFGVVLLGISIGVLAAGLIPAIAQEDATAEQADAEGMLEDMLEQGITPEMLEPLEIPETPEMLETPVTSSSRIDESQVCETVRLHYMRDIEALQMLLESIKEDMAPDVSVAAATSPAPLIVLAGPRSQVDASPRYALTCGPFRSVVVMRKPWPGERRRRGNWRKQWAISCAAICANWRPVPGPRNSATRKQQSKPNSRRPPPK